MTLPRFAVERPVLTVMVTLIVMILGGISFLRVPIDLMPDVSYPTLSMSVSYGNASPEEMEELVTRPLEEAVSAVPGVQEFSSESMEGSCRVRVMFAWGTDLDAAANDVRDRLDRVAARLPEDATKPTLRKFDISSFPILILGAASDLDPVQIRKLIEDQVKYRVERVPGVAALDVFGGYSREIHVRFDKDKVKALGLSLDSVLAKLAAENVNVPGGVIEKGNLEVLIRTRGQFADLDEIRETTVALRDGVPVLLGEVAEIADSWEKETRIVRINGKPGIQMAVNKQSGANTVAVAKGVMDELAKINEDLPQVKLTPIINTSGYIETAIGNVTESAVYGGLLAVVILFFFLRSVRSTLIIATSIPFSIVATFALIYFGGFTINLMTLGGLALGVGMLLDNSIVVLENIFRLGETGMPRRQAAINGSGEVTMAIIASTLTTLAVFLPLIFVRGMAGVIFKQLSFVVAFSLACSLFTALTLVPMLSARLIGSSAGLPPGIPAPAARRLSPLGRFFRGLENNYMDLLRFSLRHKALVVLGAMAALGGSLALIPLIGVELMPTADEGEVRVRAEMETGTRLSVLREKFDVIEKMVTAAVPEMKSSVTEIGGGGGGPGGGHASGNSGSMRISLKPKAERKRSDQEISADLQKMLSVMPGVKFRVSPGSGMFMMRMMSGGTERLQVEVRGHDLATADKLAERVRQEIEEVDGVTYTSVSREPGNPEEWIAIDRKMAADMKLTVSQVAKFVETSLTGTGAGFFRESGDEYKILVQIKDAERLKLYDLMDLTVTNPDGQPVALRNIASIESRTGPTRISRDNQERVVTVSGNISGRDMGSIIRDARERLKSVPVPEDFSVVFAGDYEEQQKTFTELLLSLILSIVLVYMVMACQYESLLDPFIVMFSVPLAIIGVAVMLFLTRTSFNMQ